MKRFDPGNVLARRRFASGFAMALKVGSYTRVTTAFKVIGSTGSARLSLLQIAMSRSKLLMLRAYYRPGCRTMKPTNILPTYNSILTT
jgi:hypothetical protein